FHFGQRSKSLRPMRAQIVADLAHEFDGPGIDSARRPRAGAGDFHFSLSESPGKRLRHLAAIGIFDADKENSFSCSRFFHPYLLGAARDETNDQNQDVS